MATICQHITEWMPIDSDGNVSLGQIRM